MMRVSKLMAKTLLIVVFAAVGSLSSARNGGQAGATGPKIPEGTVFFAKLTTPLNFSKATVNAPVEAEVTQDVKIGHDVVIKKGSTLAGHVQTIQPPTADKKETYVVIRFDAVRPKKGETAPLVAVIQALAPESDTESSSLAETTGTSLQGATRVAGVTGHSSSNRGDIGKLSNTSSGVIDIAGLQLGDRVSDGKHYTLLATSLKDLTLKKGTQLVMKTGGE